MKFEFGEARGIQWAKIDGRYLHSARNPLREAANVIDAVETQGAAGFILFGSGLGYVQQVLTERFPEHPLAVFEPVAGWEALLAESGLSQCISAGGNSGTRDASQLPGPGEDRPAWVMEMINLLFENYRLIIPESYRSLFPEQMACIEDAKNANTSRSDINRNTLKRFGNRWVENLVTNYLELGDSSGSINPFRKFAPDCNCLLLAGGPGLNVVLPMLTELSRKCLIVAVDTAYPRCQQAGIEPDFVVSVDPQYWNSKHMERHLPGSAVLISEASSFPRTFRLLKRRPYFFRSVFPLGQFTEEGCPRDSLGSGGSVATTAWDFCRYIGAGRIYTAGLDMGFPELETHFRGSYFEQTIAFSGNRLKPAEQQSFQYLYSGNPIKASDYRGDMVLSDSRMEVYCNWFETRLAQPGAPDTANLNPRARQIPGIRVAEPREIATLPPTALQYRKSLGDLPPTNPEPNTVHAISRTIGLLGAMENIAKLCRNALELLEANIPQREMLQELDLIDSSIMAGEDRTVAGFLIQDLLEQLSAMPPPADLKEALGRSRTLYRELGDSAALHTTIFRKVLKKNRHSRGKVLKTTAPASEHNLREKTPLD